MYVLHFAPDNASLIVRLVLEEMGVPFRTVLVDRRIRQQDSAAYRALNPAGLIPVLETPEGPIAETGAIVLWLSETHDAMAAQQGSQGRAGFLQTLMFLANSVHADIRAVFYPEQYAGKDPATQRLLHDAMTARVNRHFDLLEARCGGQGLGEEQVSICDYYLALLLRWAALYAPHGADWFDLSCRPKLYALCERLEARDAVVRARIAEGLGPHPFTAPQPPNPPQGSVLG